MISSAITMAGKQRTATNLFYLVKLIKRSRKGESALFIKQRLRTKCINLRRRSDVWQLLAETERLINVDSKIGEHHGLLINFRFPRVKWRFKLSQLEIVNVHTVRILPSPLSLAEYFKSLSLQAYRVSLRRILNKAADNVGLVHLRDLLVNITLSLVAFAASVRLWERALCAPYYEINISILKDSGALMKGLWSKGGTKRIQERLFRNIVSSIRYYCRFNIINRSIVSIAF